MTETAMPLNYSKTQACLASFLINVLYFLKKDSREIKVVVRSLKKGITIFDEDFSEKNSDFDFECYENLLNLSKNGRAFSTNLLDQMNGALAYPFDMDKLICSTTGLSLPENVLVSIKILAKISGEPEEKLLEYLKKSGAPLPKEFFMEENLWCKVLHLKV